MEPYKGFWNLNNSSKKQIQFISPKGKRSELKLKVLSKKHCLKFKWKSLSHVQLCDPMDYTVHGILQARILERVTFPFSRGSLQPRDRTQVSCMAGRIFTSWATVWNKSLLQKLTEKATIHWRRITKPWISIV